MDALASIVAEVVEREPEDDYTLAKDTPPYDGTIHVKGDSMYPLLWNGDMVLYKATTSKRSGLFFGSLYVVAYEEDGEQCIVVKYVDESEFPGYYTLRSHNPEYAPRDIPCDNVLALALVKASFRHYM